MAKSKLPLIALVVLLVGGLAAAGIYLMADDDRPDRPDVTKNGDKADKSDRDDTRPDTGPGPDRDDPPDTTDPDTTTPDTPDTPEPGEWQSYSLVAEFSGMVTFADNNTPAAGATVTVTLPVSATGHYDGFNLRGARNHTFSGSAVTDSAGKFKLEVATAWEFNQAIADANRPADVAAGTIPMPVVDLVATVVNRGEGRIERLTLRQFPHADMHLQVGFPSSLRGRVLRRGSDEPVAGATIYLHRQHARPEEPEPSSRRRVVSADAWGPTTMLTTDAEGRFESNAIPAGSYSIAVNAPGFEYYNVPGMTVLEEGKTHDLGDIWIATVTSITGRVIHPETGEPVSGAEVRLSSTVSAGARYYDATHTGVDGRFDFTIHRVQEYALTIRASDVGAYLMEQVPITAGERTDLGDLVLNMGGSLGGIVVDGSGAGIAGASVSVREGSLEGGWMMMATYGEDVGSALSNEEGRFEIRGMLPGPHVVSVTAEGYARYERQITFPVTDLVIELLEGGQLDGTVVNHDGSQVPSDMHVTVAAIPRDGQLYQLVKSMPHVVREIGSEAGFAAVLENGRYTIRNVPPGTYLVVAATEDENSGWQDNVEVKDRVITQVDPIQLGGRGSLRVTVLRNGVPQAEASLSVMQFAFMDFNESDRQTTDANGTALFEDLRAGSYLVRLRDESEEEIFLDASLMSRRRVTVRTGELTEFTLELESSDAYHLEGKLTLDGENAFEQFVLFGSGDRRGALRVLDGESGDFRFRNLLPGTYFIHASRREGPPAVAGPIRVESKGVTRFDHDFRSLRVSGSVVAPGAEAGSLGEAEVALTTLHPDAQSFAALAGATDSVQPNGTFEFVGVTNGEYSITASMPGFGRTQVRINVGGADITGLTITLSTEVGHIRIKQKSVQGSPVATMPVGVVNLKDASGNLLALSQERGGMIMYDGNLDMVIRDLAPGTYTLNTHIAGFLPVGGTVVVKAGETADMDVDLIASAVLHVTAPGDAIPVDLLEQAQVTLFDASGAEIPRVHHIFDALMLSHEPQDRPTIAVQHLGKNVATVRIRVPGYAEVSIPFEFKAGERVVREIDFQPE